MRRWLEIPLLAAATAVGGCVENTAPGNDREAGLDPPSTPAEVTAPERALTGVSVGLIVPETMNEADRGAIPDVGEECRFRMTRLGFPAGVYGSSAVLKLNGKLVPLPREAEGRYGAAGISVTFRPLADASDRDGTFETEMVLRLPGAPNELGFHGFSTCR